LVGGYRPTALIRLIELAPAPLGALADL
jgi:hypothetical protein